jgi:SHS2 domain-containing protein
MYRWIDHTAEVELEIEAATEHEVFAEALVALAELLEVNAEDTGHAWERAQRTVHVSAHDRPALLAGWLEELVHLAESEGFVATGIDRLDLSDDEANSTVDGVLDDPPPLVKAVTYHRLRFAPTERGFLAGLVLDV